MAEHKQKELLGNNAFIHLVEEEGGPYYGEGRLLPGTPEDIAEIEKEYSKVRDRVASEVSHDETGIDTERIAGFLGKYGLKLHPFLAVPQEELPKLESILGEQIAGEGRVLGAHSPTANITYVIRNKELEEGNGTGVTEAILVHEEIHANKSLVTVVYGEGSGGTFTGITRSGFKVEDGTEGMSGSYFEEGLAALMEHKYVTEVLDRPNGFSDWSGAQIVSVGGETYKIPRSYWVPSSRHNRFGEVSTPSFAAYGMELLIAKDPSIFDAILKARHSTEGLREFAQKIEALDKGLYRLLGRQPYRFNYFLGATNHIIERLYDGDQDKALETVYSPASTAT